MGLDYEVEGPDFKDPYLIHKSLTSAFIWLTLNLTLSFSNKWLFQHEVQNKLIFFPKQTLFN